MLDRPPPTYQADAGQEARYHALLGLHALSNRFDDIDLSDLTQLTGFRKTTPAQALELVARAPTDEIPESARLGVLFDLATAHNPQYESAEQEYRQLASTVAGPHGLDTDQLLTDLKSAAEGVAFQSTTSGRTLPHQVTAFIGQDVCTTRPVSVGGLKGTWVFSEFETDAPFKGVVEWLDPRNWSTWGPTFFKRMDVVASDGPIAIGTPADDHWHGVFHEEVQLLWRLNTLLHCDFWTDREEAAGMTYELELSLDSQIGVDRGFLLVNDLGSVRRVKALKIVGFTNPLWDDVAMLVKPFWTDWMRAAVRDGSHTVPKAPTHVPAGATNIPSGDTGGGALFEKWVEFFGDSARVYASLFDDVTSRLTSGGAYNPSDCIADEGKVWTQLAKDWASAWGYGMETLGEVSQQGLDAGLTPPGTPREEGRGVLRGMAVAAGSVGAAATGATGTGPSGMWGARAAAAPTETGPVDTGPVGTGPASNEPEATIVPLPGIGPSDQLRVTALESIEAGGATIPASSLAVTVVAIDGTTNGARIVCRDRVVAAGLYLGQLQNSEGRPLAPVQLYVSRAAGA